MAISNRPHSGIFSGSEPQLYSLRSEMVLERYAQILANWSPKASFRQLSSRKSE